jgi:serine/threonine-protein kinase HipA
LRFEPVRALRVRLAPGDRSVGRLATRDGRIYFEYDPTFLASGLELSVFGLPLRAGVTEGPREPFDGLHGLFADSLPDGWGRLLLDREMERIGVGHARLRPLDRLAWIGDRGLGALTFEPVHPGPRPPEIIELSRLASTSLEVLRGKADDLVPALLAVGGSPGGDRPKALVWIRVDDTAVYGRDDPDADAWIVKFRSRGDDIDAGAVEFVYLEMARRAGIQVPEARLFGRGAREPGFVGIRRFDRRRSGGRVHVHTLCGLLHADHRIPSATYEDLLAATRALTRDEREVRAQFRRMVFNVLTHNRDDHTRNHAFMMGDEGQWRLAPAYDLTHASGPGGEHSMSVGGEGRSPGVEAFARCADKAGLDPGIVAGSVEAVRAALDDFDELADEAGVTAGTRRRIRRVLG